MRSWVFMLDVMLLKLGTLSKDHTEATTPARGKGKNDTPLRGKTLKKTILFQEAHTYI